MLNPFMLLLGGAGILSFVAFGIDPSQTLNAVLGGVLFAVVILTVLMSFSQERKTIKTMAAFKNILPSTAVVLRDGVRQDIEARSLVVGDIVMLSLGQKVPADVRLLSTSSLKAENGAITGESEPVELDASAVYVLGETPVEEAKNIAFNGSLILDGSGIGVVLATGDKSLIGRIAALTTGTEVRQSSMEIEVQRFVRFISILAISMAVVFFIIDVARRSGVGALNSFINGFLVIIVANVPQGLPATVTSLQLIVAKRLAGKKVFVKRLDAVETLGAVTVIASDKTGTLTMNKMTVVDGWVNCQIGLHFFSEALFLGSQLRASIVDVGSVEKFVEKALSSVILLQIIACVCNNAVGAVATPLQNSSSAGVTSLVGVSDQMMTQFSGNPSEVALLNFFEGFRPGIVNQLRGVYPVVFQIPFNSSNKFHVVIVEGSLRPGEQDAKQSSKHTILMKGAPEVLLKRCSRFVRDGLVHEMDDEFMNSALEAYPYFARRGQRVLGFCMAEVDHVGEFDAKTLPLTNLTFVGMLAIMDPPRADVPGALIRCFAAGIKVFMVTGDHPITAAAIALQIGLLPDGSPVSDYQAGTSASYGTDNKASLVIHGQQIESFTDDDWAFVLARRSLVFARTTPQHKLLITEKCQERKEVVCMTGDGVNDAPALKRANIGVSMGINGSEVAREASDVILMDDNFASIVLGVEAGRQLFDNLKKTIAYTLAHLAPEIVPVLLTLALGFPPLLSSLQILSVDLLTELAPAISLAYEPKERDVMDQPPRNLAFAYVGPGDVAIIPEPAYQAYLGGTLLSDATPYSYALRPRTNFLVELDDIPDATLEKTRVLYLNYPNNPTAAIAPREYLERVVATCRERDILLVYDNAYSEMGFDGYVPPSIFEIDGAKDVAIEFHSLSKTFNMTGWRCGWAVAKPEIAGALAKVKGFADTGQYMAIQAAGVAALDSWETFVPGNLKVFAERRDAAVAAFRAEGFTCDVPKATMYLWIPLPEGMLSRKFADTLREEEGVIVLPGSGFGEGGEGFFRISFIQPPNRLAEAAARAGRVLNTMLYRAAHPEANAVAASM